MKQKEKGLATITFDIMLRLILTTFHNGRNGIKRLAHAPGLVIVTHESIGCGSVKAIKTK